MEMIVRPDRSLFIVEDDATFAKTLKRSFEKRDYDVVVCHDREALLSALETTVPAYAVVDLKLGAGGSGLECVKLLSARDASIRMVVLTGVASIATAV
ncbi:response regulator, partial [Mesorhizobium sp. M2D.F.Ca.ET.147.01.1.1]